MSTFHLFGHLAVECRLKIWEAFLTYETEERRLVILDSRHGVRPTVYLQCPLMSVNRESRKFARYKYYTVALAVYRLPKLQPGLPDAQSPGGCEEAGTVYISAEHDTFLLSEIENTWEYGDEPYVPNQNETDPTKRQCRTQSLDEETLCCKIRNSMEIRDICYHDLEDRGIVFDDVCDSEFGWSGFWHEHTWDVINSFYGIERCTHLWPDACWIRRRDLFELTLSGILKGYGEEIGTRSEMVRYEERLWKWGRERRVR